MNDIIVQNFYYFSVKLSLKPRINFATSDIKMFISSINNSTHTSTDGLDFDFEIDGEEEQEIEVKELQLYDIKDMV